ncbi:MAG: DUF2141 domain-containing protein [Chakrabartia sp.]
MPTKLPAAETASASTVEFDISGVRNAKGRVLVCLTANPKAYPDCGKDPASRKLSLPAASTLVARFENVPAGTYAAALIHDENANNRMDLALFLPREGFGMSRNPKIGMGPPSFKSAQFAVSGSPVRLPITMRYMF